MRAPDVNMHALLQLMYLVMSLTRSSARSHECNKRQFFSKNKTENNKYIFDLLGVVNDVPLFLNNWSEWDEDVFLSTLIKHDEKWSRLSGLSLTELYRHELQTYLKAYPNTNPSKNDKSVIATVFFLNELKALLVDWEFAGNAPYFTKVDGINQNIKWSFHTRFIQHASGYDALGSVIVEFKEEGREVYKISADLGEIEGVGLLSFPFCGEQEAKSSAAQFYRYFEEVGLPFLKRYSDISSVIKELKQRNHDDLLDDSCSYQYKA